MNRYIYWLAASGVTLTAFAVAAAGAPAATIASPAGLGCQASMSKAIPQPTLEQLDAAGLGDVPLAPNTARRDLVAAPFSNSTAVTNALFPIRHLASAILNGRVDDKVFNTETTLLPYTQIVEWTPGQCVRVLVSQYMAFLDGRLEETAIDFYTQANDGSVWYLGESVFDYDEAGLIITTDGTWHAGLEGPAAMIMPADPRIGDAYRPENIPGIVFEELRVTRINQTFDGPSGPISGVMVGIETHQNGSTSEKVFAPGYGELLSTTGRNFEAMALASPTDSRPGGVPDELVRISKGADSIFASKLVTLKEWTRARTIARRMLEAWEAFRTGDVPPRLVEPTDVALRNLVARVASRNRSETYSASIAASYASNDLQLRYQPVTNIDTMRFELWVRRALVDATNHSLAGVRSDLVTLEWIRDRIAHTLTPLTLTEVDTLVRDLGTAVRDEDLMAAAQVARDQREIMDDII